MADQNQRRIELVQGRFQPFNSGQVEMVGRLIEQQHFRLRGHYFGQRRAAAFTARQRGNLCRRIEVQIRHDLEGALLVFIIQQAVEHIIANGLIAAKIWVLGEIFNGNAGLHKALAVIHVGQASDDFHQR